MMGLYGKWIFQQQTAAAVKCGGPQSGEIKYDGLQRSVVYILILAASHTVGSSGYLFILIFIA